MTDSQLSMARRMINASICAYQIHERGWTPGKGSRPPVTRTIQGPNDSYFYNVVPAYQDHVGFIGTVRSGYAPLFVASGKDKINAALVGAMDDGNVLLALRGTIPPSLHNNDLVEWIKDWIQDADIPPTRWSAFDDHDTGDAHAETGFADAMVSLWPDLQRMIDKTIETHQCTGFVITGHSKGAAMTFLAATLVRQAYPKFKDKIQCHAFAPPVAGDKGFRKAYHASDLDKATHRYQVENDVVPFVPLWREANLFEAIDLKSKWLEEFIWHELYKFVRSDTKGGYDAVGDFTYFDSNHDLVPDTVVQQTALPAVAKSIMAGKFATVADAHSAVHSYLPCLK